MNNVKNIPLAKLGEWRFVVLLLFLLVLVSSAGMYLYKTLTTTANTVNHATPRNTRASALIQQISVLSGEAENHVRSYRLTHRQDYLVSFYQLMPGIEQQLVQLKTLTASGIYPAWLCDSVVTLTQQRFELLRQLLYLQDESQITEELSALSKSIDQAFAAASHTVNKSDVLASDNKQESFFQRLFGRRAKKQNTQTVFAKPDKNGKDTLIKTQLKNNVVKTKQKQLEQLTVLQNKDLALMQQSKTLTDRMNRHIRQAETQEHTESQQNIERAKTEVNELKQLALLTSVLVSLLLLLLAYMILNYVRKKRDVEKALLEAKQQAEALAKTKERFLANMSHEIKTPLNAIHGFTEQLLESVGDHTQKQQLAIVKKSADYLSRLVTNILNYSKLEAGKVQLNDTELELRKEMQELELLFKQELRSTSVHFSMLVDPQLPALIRLDETCFKQILFNLVGNAVKFTEKGQVNVLLERIPGNDNRLRILVTDTGIGIAAEKIPLLFNEYEQAGAHISKTYGGTGLGLVITKKLAEQLGGFIRLSSIEKKGTEVEVQIPYETCEGVPDDKATQANNAATAFLVGKSVLVVDDEEFNRLLLRAILLKHGVLLQEAVNGAEAIDKVLHQAFDLVIMDIRMPVKNGLEACGEIRRFEKKLPILASTAVISEDNIERCIAAGFTGFVHKPVSEKKLLAVMQEVLTDVSQAPSEKTQAESSSLNFTDLKHVSGGDEEFEKELLKLFHASINKGLRDMEKLAQQGTPQAMADLAHKMLPPCKHFDAHRLQEILQHFERLGTQAASEKHVQQQLKALRAEIETINAELSLYL